MKKIFSFLAVLIFLVNFNVSYGDAGPKPTLEINISGIDGDSCIVDLLVKDSGENSWEPRIDYDGDFLSNYELIKNYEENGWKAAQANGLSLMSGYPEISISDDGGTVRFGYRIPEEFKIIAVNESGEIFVSDIVNRKAFDSVVDYNVKTGKAKERSIISSFVRMFLKTFIATVIIEGLILIIFGLFSVKNIKTLLKINLGTQLFLSLSIAAADYSMGIILAFLAFGVCEIIIFAVEIKLYRKFLEKGSGRRKLLFAICANFASLIAGTYFVSL